MHKESLLFIFHIIFHQVLTRFAFLFCHHRTALDSQPVRVQPQFAFRPVTWPSIPIMVVDARRKHWRTECRSMTVLVYLCHFSLQAVSRGRSWLPDHTTCVCGMGTKLCTGTKLDVERHQNRLFHKFSPWPLFGLGGISTICFHRACRLLSNKRIKHNSVENFTRESRLGVCLPRGNCWHVICLFSHCPNDSNQLSMQLSPALIGNNNC